MTTRPERTKQTTTRWLKILKISQAHLAPGMNLQRWQEIIARHQVGNDWETVGDQVIDEIITEITAIVQQARGAIND
jgi:hypothetical protein